MIAPSDPGCHRQQLTSEVSQLQGLLQRLEQNLQRDRLVQDTVNELQQVLQVNRVLIYYFYRQWEGQVTFESLSHPHFSIFGSTGPDQCFNDDYADLYLAGRVRAIADIETEPIAPCHRDFLRQLQVRANLSVPILIAQGLWGLLIAHHCQESRAWTQVDIERMQSGAMMLASATAIGEQ
ncbi:MAG: GAF domain-containing protein [Spirulina sp. SIO3F2]|nr:GAF domain-containing protein [Spirulina sp. SIO3F2]